GVVELHCDHGLTEQLNRWVSGCSQQLRRKMKSARHHQARNAVLAELAKPLDAQFRGQTFQIRMFRCAQHLHTFLGEIGVEPRERESGAIDGGLANLSMEPDARALELYLQLFSVRTIKTLNRNNRNALLLIA